MRHTKHSMAAAAAALISLAAAPPGAGRLQDGGQAQRLLATRAELKALVPRLDSLTSATSDGEVRETARQDVERARTRLATRSGNPPVSISEPKRSRGAGKVSGRITASAASPR